MKIDSDRAITKHLGDVELACLRGEEEFVCLLLCSFEDRVCDSWGLNDAKFIFVYKTMFKDLGMRLPFTEFECGVLVQMNVAPIQLHPNSWAFVHYFEILMEFLGEEPNLNVFFSFFQVKGVGGYMVFLECNPWVEVIWLVPKQLQGDQEPIFQGEVCGKQVAQVA